jgi:hypothetical protein
MAADNNLSSEAYTNIDELERSFPKNNEENKIVVYIDSEYSFPQILEIVHDETEEYVSKVVKKYEEHNSADFIQMQSILEDIINMYPSDTYSLVLWSHGTSWTPPNVKSKSFGDDNYDEMDIKDLANALPIKFEYIIFDACLMGSIEVAYQLREKAEYILSSSTEILSYGFPYQTITPYLFGGRNDLITITELYYNFYNSLNGINKSASISLIATNELRQLALKTKYVIETYPLEKWKYNSEIVQTLDVYENHISFDFLDFLLKNYPEDLIEPIKEQLSKVVVTKYNTEQFLNQYYILSFCGISCYIPSADNVQLNEYYKTLTWCNASGFNLLFD